MFVSVCLCVFAHQDKKESHKTSSSVAFGYLSNKQIICLFSFPPDTANKCRIKISKWSNRQSQWENARECGCMKGSLMKCRKKNTHTQLCLCTNPYAHFVQSDETLIHTKPNHIGMDFLLNCTIFKAKKNKLFT